MHKRYASTHTLTQQLHPHPSPKHAYAIIECSLTVCSMFEVIDSFHISYANKYLEYK